MKVNYLEHYILDIKNYAIIVKVVNKIYSFYFCCISKTKSKINSSRKN